MKIQVNNKEYSIKWVHKFLQKEDSIKLDPLKKITMPKTTLCSIISKEKVCVGVGIAICSLSDIYNKETGRKISLARALKEASFNKQARTKFWKAYRTMGDKERWQ